MTAAHTGSILVVDDDPINRMLFSRSLVADGHTVRTAEHGVSALELLAEARDDVVLLDIVMPEMDGIEVLEAIKADPKLRDMPVIMISGLDDYANVVRCIEAGAEDYLPKPFDPVLLRARIAAGLNKRRVTNSSTPVYATCSPGSCPSRWSTKCSSTATKECGWAVCGWSARRSSPTCAVSPRSPESTPPDRVIDVLNRFFGEMSDAMLDNGGTLVAFLGTACSPSSARRSSADDHADRALRAAREMLTERLPRFNQWLRDTSAQRRLRGSVSASSSGPLMSGNVGSERRLEYTAVGDTVNTASRLESLTKEVSHALLISDSTRELLTDDGPTWSSSTRSH